MKAKARTLALYQDRYAHKSGLLEQSHNSSQVKDFQMHYDTSQGKAIGNISISLADMYTVHPCILQAI